MSGTVAVSVLERETRGRHMTVQQAEAAASRLLSTSWWDAPKEERPLPVDPFAIAAALGITVRRIRLPLDESGNIVLAPDADPLISLNRGDSPARQRFTCAHEIGHYFRRLESGSLDRQVVFVDRRAQLASAGVDAVEIYANQFAAALLMPARAVQQGYVFEGHRPEALARRFDTSVQAMNLRLRNLNLA